MTVKMTKLACMASMSCGTRSADMGASPMKRRRVRVAVTMLTTMPPVRTVPTRPEAWERWAGSTLVMIITVLGVTKTALPRPFRMRMREMVHMDVSAPRNMAMTTLTTARTLPTRATGAEPKRSVSQPLGQVRRICATGWRKTTVPAAAESSPFTYCR